MVYTSKTIYRSEVEMAILILGSALIGILLSLILTLLMGMIGSTVDSAIIGAVAGIGAGMFSARVSRGRKIAG